MNIHVRLAKSQNSRSTHKNKFYFFILAIEYKIKFLKILFTMVLRMKSLGTNLLKHTLYV